MDCEIRSNLKLARITQKELGQGGIRINNRQLAIRPRRKIKEKYFTMTEGRKFTAGE